MKLSQPKTTGIFDDLKRYSRAQVDLNNCFQDLFSPAADWPSWIEEGLGSLLSLPAQSVILLEQANQVEPRETRKWNFAQSDVSIGREHDNDIVVALPGVGRHHARITRQGGRHLLEDLGSANGTYLNDARLNPHEPAPLQEGSRFLIFPHQFTFSIGEVWLEEQPVRVAGGGARLTVWKERRINRFGNSQYFNLKVLPGVGNAVVTASQNLLQALLEQITHGAADYLLPYDTGLFEFLMLSILERANRDLRFPFRFALEPFEPRPLHERGISAECVVGLGDTVGSIDLFFPASLLLEARRHIDAAPIAVPVSWPVTVTCAYADLCLQDFADLETGDILLTTSRHELLLPRTHASAERGWSVSLSGESAPLQLRVDEYFERKGLIMESHPASSEAQKPDLTSLPIRVQIVLGQIEMSLADLNRLAPGAIVELDRDKSETVQLAVNGRIAGSGELVEIEGRLGVRIASWASK